MASSMSVSFPASKHLEVYLVDLSDVDLSDARADARTCAADTDARTPVHAALAAGNSVLRQRALHHSQNASLGSA